MTFTQRRPTNVYHSDSSESQYASGDYRALLDAHGVVMSMSRRGNSWDNAVAESFFSTLKHLVSRARRQRTHDPGLSYCLQTRKFA